jgi:hypothetical protein
LGEYLGCGVIRGCKCTVFLSKEKTVIRMYAEITLFFEKNFGVYGSLASI